MVENRSRTPDDSTRMTHVEIFKLVNDYIGVSQGYLGDFSYRSHEEFYPIYCELDINPSSIEGTTRSRFIKILQNSDGQAQAKIIWGILKKYPVESKLHRTQTKYNYFESLAKRLEGDAAISSPTITDAAEVLRRALDDVEILLRENGPISSLDRIHTALHSYLISACNRAGITYDANQAITRLFRLLREQHPTLVRLSTGSEEINRILMACATILDALNPIRNQLSVAHPSPELLGNDEAMLVVNIGRTILHYFNSKFE